MYPNPATRSGRRLNKENKVLCNTTSGYDKNYTVFSDHTLPVTPEPRYHGPKAHNR